MGWYYNIKLGSAKDNIKVIGIRHGEKMYETLLTKEECAKAIDMVISRQSVPLAFFKGENLEYSIIIRIFDLKMKSKIGGISEKLKYYLVFHSICSIFANGYY